MEPFLTCGTEFGSDFRDGWRNFSQEGEGNFDKIGYSSNTNLFHGLV
jgi:hypothetical protein